MRDQSFWSLQMRNVLVAWSDEKLNHKNRLSDEKILKM